MLTPEEEANEDRIVEAAAASLIEHFDTVQIFVTRHEPDTKEKMTVSLAFGLGNVFAREGQVQNWLARKDEYTRQKIRDGMNQDGL